MSVDLVKKNLKWCKAQVKTTKSDKFRKALHVKIKELRRELKTLNRKGN